eukprot:TRINITY_DN121611_c0_g1_i1.p1 TRINITY_DN121611_c0_g1~~TRINITY_DN121611_c0_g1_i1.p1  ORF type:complete len:668 (+),score=15.71 TRINITY_DN121611_c0_g1_i1:91-2004(+)
MINQTIYLLLQISIQSDLMGLSAVLFALLTIGSACGSLIIQAVDGSFRKDYYLPYSHYPEYHQPDPVHGGRVHVVATVSLDSSISSLLINGISVKSLLIPPYDFTNLDWARYIHDPITNQLWVSFHSRNDTFIKTVNITIQTTQGQTKYATYVPTLSPVLLTWVTPVNETHWIFHITNQDNHQSFYIKSIIFDGLQVDTYKQFPAVIHPLSRLVVVAQPKYLKSRGDLFTVRVGYSESLTGVLRTVAYGGKTPSRHFQIETWPTSSDCPVPGRNHTAWLIQKSHGIDTIFYEGGNFRKHCGMDIERYVQSQVLQKNSAFLWTDEASVGRIPRPNYEVIEAVLLADENDGELKDSFRKTLVKSTRVQDKYGNLLTYQGGKTNRHNGAYSGITDIQGMDFYVAACAPTIIGALSAIPIQGSFAYLRNARNNHMPLQTISYSQLYSHAWNYQAKGPEIAMQLASVVISGSKGLSLFQSTMKYIHENQKDWDGILRNVFLNIVALGEIIRTGDVQGLVVKSTDKGDPFYSIRSITEVIRNHQWIAIVVVNMHAGGYSSLLCEVGMSKHWKFKDHVVQKVEITFTPDVMVDPKVEMVELMYGKHEKLQNVVYKVEEGKIVLENVKLLADLPVRFFLLPYKLA